MTVAQHGAPVAVLGLGRMGAPIAGRLADAGFVVSGYDPRPSDVPFPVAGSATGAVTTAQFVLTVLPGTPEVRALMLDDGLLDALHPGTVWVDCTSTVPEVAAELLAECAARGIARLDCGLGGGPGDAGAGALTLYVGGTDELVERCGPVLAAMAAPERIHHVGGPGSGTLAKLLVNLVWFGQATLTTEALLLARSSGLDPRALTDLLPATPAASAFATDYLPRLLAGDYAPTFGLDRVVEELDGLERLAEHRDSPFATGTAITEVHRAAYARYGAEPGELLGAAYLAEQAGGPLG